MNSPFKEALERALLSMQGLTPTQDLNMAWDKDTVKSLTPAAVLVPIRCQSGALILTQRSTQLKHHPGQIAFAGGKQDPNDANLIETAKRESFEEIALAPKNIHVIGAMPTHVTISRFVVTPILALIPEETPLTAQTGEVSDIFEVPFNRISQPKFYQEHSRIWRGQPRKYYAAPYGAHYIWGATAHILKTLCDHLQEQQPHHTI